MEQEPPIELETPSEIQAKPTESVGTFWDRLDQVLELNLQSAQMRERVESLLEEFPDQAKLNESRQSFLFNPERITLSSDDDVQVQLPNSTYENLGGWTSVRPVLTFSTFTLKLQRMLRGVKSIQLISASIPNATIMIPNEQRYFWYYRIQSLANSTPTIWSNAVVYTKGQTVQSGGAPNRWYASKINNNLNNPLTDTNSWNDCGIDGTQPNYFQLIDPNNLEYVSLATSYQPPELSAPTITYVNRTFQDYQDLVNSLNAAAATANLASIANDVSFQFNAQVNRIQFVPSNTANYFYIVAGYLDPQIEQQRLGPLAIARQTAYKPLNLRLGFTWTGLWPDLFGQNPYTNNFATFIYPFMRPAVPGSGFPYNQNIITGQSYPDLVYSSTCRIFADFVLGSTEDSRSQGGLLATIPMNANNLGIAFYQSAFNNPLTKIPENITEIAIRLVTDSGEPFYLPNSAIVNLELAVSYK